MVKKLVKKKASKNISKKPSSKKKELKVTRTKSMGGNTPDDRVVQIYKQQPIKIRRRVDEMWRAHVHASRVNGTPDPEFGRFILEAIEVATLESNDAVVASYAKPGVKWEPAVHYPQYVTPKDK